MSTSRSRAATYHHGDLREALIASALTILEEGGGPEALTLREAARRAGVSAMAPYRHFAHKEALIAAVADVGFSRLYDALTAADVGVARSAVLSQGVAYVAFAEKNPGLFRLMFGAAVASSSKEDVTGCGHRAFEVMAERVASIVGPAQMDDWAMLCWAAAHGIACLVIDGRLAEGDEAPTVLAERVLRLLAIG